MRHTHTARTPLFRGCGTQLLAALGTLALPGAPAVAQQRDIDPRGLEPPENPFLEHTEPENWTARVQIDVTSFQRSDRFGLEIHEWNIDTLAMIFPLIRQTSAAIAVPDGAEGELRIGDRAYTSEFKVIEGYHSDAVYGRWDARDLADVREVTLVFETRVRSWETELDERAAASIGWPEEDWPTEARSTFEPQYGVDYVGELEPSHEAVDRLLERWTEGQDPKSVAPLTLAKYLAGRVQELVQPVGRGLRGGRSRIRRGFEGFEMQGANRTIETGRGSPFDMVAALASVYRRAGLPARTVIGLREFDEFDTTDATREELESESALHAYVEFFLYDEDSGDQGWIPVDIIRLRERSSRAKSLDRDWEYFGTHDELDHFIPLSYHFHPPTTVRAYGSPAMWGWFVTPATPSVAFQQLTFATFTTPVRGGRVPEPGQD